MDFFHWNIEGWFTSEQFELYSEVVKKIKTDSHIVEIGAWKGRSTTALAVLIKNSGKNIKFDVIDTFKGSSEHQNLPCIVNDTLYQEYLNNIEPVKNIVNTIVGDSSHVASFYKDESLDFVFIDGDHSFDGVTKDILAWLPKIKPGGTIAGDDFGEAFPEVMQAVSQNIEDLKVCNTVWVYNKPESNREVKVLGDKYYRPNYNFQQSVQKAYIITLDVKDDNIINQTKRCIESCKAVGMDYEIFEGFDGTDNVQIKTPEHLKSKDYISWVKVTDTGLTVREIGCALSHIALWAHCITIDEPIVILEHDACMLKKYTHIPSINTVDYLGNHAIASELVEVASLDSISDVPNYLKEKNFHTTKDNLPMLSATNDNYFYLMGAHAYARDPFVARKLLSKVIINGLCNPNDTMISARDFSICCSGLYAMQGPEAAKVSSIMPAIHEKSDFIDKKFRQRKETFIIPSFTQ
jgi:GR25 family glycosyltransferase involved in LPS biosynthesis